MRRLGLPLALILVTAGLAGCLGGTSDEPVTPQRTPTDELGPRNLTERVFETITRTAMNATSSVDGTELRVDVYKPEANGTYPTILVLSPYWSFLGDSKDDDLSGEHPTWYIDYFVPRGYAVALGEMRGTRDSGGCWDFGGELDQQDGHDIVEAIADQPWSDGHVGMLGQSHVGMSQIATAITAPEHLDTIVPIAAVSDWYRYLHKDGAPYETNRGTPPAYFAVHASPATDPVTDGRVTPGFVLDQARTACPDNVVHLSQAAELDGDKDAYWQERDLIAGAPNITASVFLVHGFLDENVKTDHFLDFWQALPDGIEKRAWLGQWYHEHPFYHEWRDELHAWFDHELKGIDNGITDQPTVTVQTSTEEARTEPDWPSPNTTRVNWTLGTEALTVTDPSGASAALPSQEGQAETVSYLEVPGDDRGLPEEGLDRRVFFTTGEIEDPVHLGGEATLTLQGSLDQPTGRWIAVLYEVGGEDGWDEISRAYLDARHRDGNQQGEDVPAGEALTYELTFYPRDHIVQPGHELRLALVGGDIGCMNGQGACEGTGILPVERPVEHTVAIGEGSGTQLTLPVVEAAGPEKTLTELDGWLEDQPE